MSLLGIPFFFQGICHFIRTCRSRQSANLISQMVSGAGQLPGLSRKERPWPGYALTDCMPSSHSSSSSASPHSAPRRNIETREVSSLFARTLSCPQGVRYPLQEPLSSGQWLMKPAWWQVLMSSPRLIWGPCPLLMTPTWLGLSNSCLCMCLMWVSSLVGSQAMYISFCLLIKLRFMPSPAASICWLFRNTIFSRLDVSLASSQRRVLNGPWRPDKTLTLTVGLTGGAAQIKRWLSFWEANFILTISQNRGEKKSSQGKTELHLWHQYLGSRTWSSAVSTFGITSTKQRNIHYSQAPCMNFVTR